jgi:hypothetical protein
MLFVLQVHKGYNTPSHGSGPHILGPTPCEGVLCPYYVLEVQITNPVNKTWGFFRIEEIVSSKS